MRVAIFTKIAIWSAVALVIVSTAAGVIQLVRPASGVEQPIAQHQPAQTIDQNAEEEGAKPADEPGRAWINSAIGCRTERSRALARLLSGTVPPGIWWEEIADLYAGWQTPGFDGRRLDSPLGPCDRQRDLQPRRRARGSDGLLYFKSLRTARLPASAQVRLRSRENGTRSSPNTIWPAAPGSNPIVSSFIIHESSRFFRRMAMPARHLGFAEA